MTNVLHLPLEKVLTDLEYVPGRWIREASTQGLRYIVLHSMEAPETPGRARSTADYFASTPRKALTHFTSDNWNIVRCCPDNHGVYGAAGTNWNGLHIEQPGYAAQDQAAWREPYNIDNFQQVGRLCAAISVKYGIPLAYVGANGLRNNLAGIVTHNDCSMVYEPGGHWDPGPYYPMDLVVGSARLHKDGSSPEDDMPLNVGPYPMTREATGVTLAALTFQNDIIIRYSNPKVAKEHNWWQNGYAVLSGYFGRKLPENCHQPTIDFSVDGRFQIHCLGISSGKHYIAWEKPADGGGVRYLPDAWDGYSVQ